MSKLSRRAFLSSAGAVTGAAALGAAVGVPKLASGLARADGLAGPMPEGPVVAYVRDASRGELAVVRGDREVAVKDAALVRRIVDAAG
jgi:hypothetical protein